MFTGISIVNLHKRWNLLIPWTLHLESVLKIAIFINCVWFDRKIYFFLSADGEAVFVFFCVCLILCTDFSVVYNTVNIVCFVNLLLV